MAEKTIADGKVRCGTQVITLPTFPIGKGHPSPALFDLEEWYSAYPRTMLDMVARPAKPTDMQYTLWYAESDTMRVEVMPEVGGHVWSIKDKTSGRNLLWTPDCIKPIEAGRRKGFIEGGIEFPFPVSNHGQDNLDPYRASSRVNADGSGTVTVSHYDHFYGFWGSYDVTVWPGEARMALTVRLYNPTAVRNRYQIWLNAAVDTDKDAQFIFPIDWVSGHGFAGVYAWPNWDDGVDHSTWRNVPEQFGIFGWDADYMGVWYHDRDCGVIRYCDHNKARGIKAWSWGAKSHWTHEYTMNNGPSVEIQWGRWPNQEMFGWLEPHTMDTWTEWWLPAKGLGGRVDAASADAVMSVHLESSNGVPETGEVRVNVMRPVGGTLRVSSNGRTLLEKRVALATGGVAAERFDTRGLAADARLSVRLVEDGGAVVIEYDKPVRKVVTPEPKVPESVTLEGEGPEYEAFAEAVRCEVLQGHLDTAREKYEALTAEHPGFARGWRGLGLVLYKQIDYAAAEKAIAKAVELDEADAEARYYLGVVKSALGRRDGDKVLGGIEDGPFAPRARFQNGLNALRRRSWKAAARHFRQAAEKIDRDPAAWDYLALSLRLGGNAKGAEAALAKALELEPMDALAMTERLVAAGRATTDAIRKALGPDDELYFAAALFYEAAGEHAAALRIAQAAEDRAFSALHFYRTGWLAARGGDEALAKKYFAKADSMGADYVCPQRREDAEVFDVAERLGGHPAYARLHKGALLYWLGRKKEALDLWLGLLGKYEMPGLYKRVADAIGKGRIAGAYDETITLYKAALKENPRDPEIYYTLDEMYEKRGDWRLRRELLEKGREAIPEDDQLALRYARSLTRRGVPEKALEIFSTREWRRAHQSKQLMMVARLAIEETYARLAMNAVTKGENEQALAYLKEAANATETLKKWFD